MEDVIYEWLPFGLGLATILIVYILHRRLASPTIPNTDEQDESQEIADQEEKTESPKNVTKSKKISIEKRKDVKDVYSHPWLLSNLKGHSGEILDLDFSSNGKHLASCADDRSVMLWSVKTFSEKNHKSVRANIEFDHATRVKWSPDSKAFIVSVATGNVIQVYKVGKRKDGTLGNFEAILTFPETHTADIISIGISSNGQFLMSCSSDTTLIIWDLKGQILATIDTLHINNYYACVSPCGRFVASSGFTPDVRVWEVCFAKMGEFKEVKRAFELKGHTSGVSSFCFSNDSSRMVSISKDNTWKLWDTNIEYSKGQEPYLISSCNCNANIKSLIALSPDGRTISVATVSNLYVYSASNGELQAQIQEIHPDPIKSLLFSPSGEYLIVAAGRHIRIFHNIPGYKNVIMEYEAAKKKATNTTMKERLQAQIEDVKKTLKTLEDGSP